ncbi:bone morphogenetic protein 1-like [Branchiostoma floridae]|uniref:Bone morphogenetic protein 1-like n=1 Tax=Branchiostoma floridae TaxID=7739 RepID=A0A9J7M3H7_BRAFL|nr:bone morphogenetic protein 1-like [Branchiostoma floridae]
MVVENLNRHEVLEDNNNECAEVDLIQCEHRCLNTVGGYRCSCHAGYVLAMDGKRCEKIPGCGGNLTDLEAAFKSPELPVENPYDLDCIWEIIVEEDLQLSLRIALEPWEDNDVCREYVTLRQGSSPDSRELRLCQTGDVPAMYRTHSNVVTVHFRSAPPHTGGFRVEYFTTEKKHPCGGLVTGKFWFFAFSYYLASFYGIKGDWTFTHHHQMSIFKQRLMRKIETFLESSKWEHIMKGARQKDSCYY